MLEENGQDLALENKYNNSPYRIPLRNKEGKVIDYTLVDEDDYEKVNQYRWCLSKGYAQGSVNINGKKSIKLHHFVFKKPDGKNVIDHKNQDRLDNRKENLREVSASINAQNASKKNKKTSSKYIGVTFRKDLSKYRALCQGKNLGSYENELDAAITYDKYTYKVFGKDALNNKLVNYEDIININLEELVVKRDKRDLPRNIKFDKNKYIAKRTYKNINYLGTRRDTLDEALKDLQILNTKVNYILLMEEFHYLQQPIKRNKDGIAIIQVNYPNSNDKVDIFVDDELYYDLNKINWYLNGADYATNTKIGLMHRYIMNAKDKEIIDHINNKTYDNRKNNLRIVSSVYNNHNTSKRKGTSSKYLGVSHDKSKNKWAVRINKDSKSYHVGRFDTELEAAKAYNNKAKELYGDYANLNVI